MSSLEVILGITQLILTRYVLSICFILGLFGNICNICIFIEKKLRSNSCSIYFIATSVVNLLIIIFGIIPTISASYTMDPSTYLSWVCKLKLYGIHSLLMMSRVYMTLACLDQYFFCSANVRLRQFSSRQIAFKSVVIVPIIWLLIPIHMLVFVDVQIPYVRCGTSGVYSLFYSAYSFVFTSTPLICMIIFSSLAFCNLKKLNQRVGPTVNNQSTMVHNNRLRKYDYQIMIMLIFTVIVYIISNILYPTNALYVALTAVTKDSPPKSSLRLAIEGFITYLTWSFLIYINSCSMFYINFCVSKVFRLRFYRLIRTIFTMGRYEQRAQNQERANPTGVSMTLKSIRPHQ